MYKYGFWTDLDELQEEIPGANWGFLENECRTDIISPYNFLHGCCDVFAIILHQRYGYKLEYVECLGLVHAYCVAEHNGKEYYIDVRGICSCYDAFIEEFKEFIVKEPKTTRFDSLEKIPFDFHYNQVEWDKMLKERKAAEAIIKEYNYYDLEYSFRSSCYVA
nr:hypothetical protein [uncultured Butyrivibrio sp.]